MSVACRLCTLVQTDYRNIEVPANTCGCLWPKKEKKQAKANGSTHHTESVMVIPGYTCMFTSELSVVCANTGMKIGTDPDV